mmetsp:Transcript_41301/g.99501  ORF Transcript_41301/g.99501 Transcript_41301/m.99501 type:complete len:403 (+) Transcript_41301:255-1463(+)
MPERRPHAVLGVSKDASEAEIRTAYHKAAKKYHPDRQSSQQEKDKANLMFNQVNEAYESLISQFHNHYGDEGEEGEQDLADERPSRNRPKEGGKKARTRSSTKRNSENVEKPSSFSSTRREKKPSDPASPVRRKDPVKTHRRASSASNSPSSKRKIRTSRTNIQSPGAVPKSPGSMSTGKKTRDSIRSPNPIGTTTPRPRPRPVQRNSSAPHRHSSVPVAGGGIGTASPGPQSAGPHHRRSRSSLAGGVGAPPPPRPPLEHSPLAGRKKSQTPQHSPVSSSPHSTRRVSNLRGSNRPSSGRNMASMDASLSPRRAKKSPVHARHSSFGSLNYNNVPPPPAMSSSPGPSPVQSRPSSLGNLKTLKKARAPPPPQSTLQRLSMKLTNRSELKAEKKARAEKLME